MLLIPVDLDVIVGGQLGEVPQVLLYPVHVQRGTELHHRTLGVGEESPAEEVARHHVPPHADAPMPGPPPLPRSRLVLDPCVVQLLTSPAKLPRAHLGLEAAVIRELGLDAHHLPETVARTQHVVNPLKNKDYFKKSYLNFIESRTFDVLRNDKADSTSRNSTIISTMS